MNDKTNVVGATETEPESGYPRLETQIKWYDSKSGSAQWWYKRLKLVELACAALVPFLASRSVVVTALLGVVIVVLESVQQLNQFHHNWITYRSTCESLRHEKYSYLGRTGSYANKSDEDSKKVLVEQVEALTSTEHSKWLSRQENRTPHRHSAV